MNDVRLTLKEGMLTILLNGEVDHHNAREIRETIDETAGKTKPRELILDFSRTQFVDGSDMELIMGRYRLMQVLGGFVTIVNLPPKVKKVISIVGLGKLVKFEKGMVYRETSE